jgi:hypothetical protein
MEVRIRGQMTIADIRQALFEQLHELETKYAVQFSRGATLYINPTNVTEDSVFAIRRPRLTTIKERKVRLE